jgi:hypothetical protein
VEAKALKTNIAIVIGMFLYECILTMFRCPLTIVTGQEFISLMMPKVFDKSFFVETCEFYNLSSLKEWVG